MRAWSSPVDTPAPSLGKPLPLFLPTTLTVFAPVACARCRAVAVSLIYAHAREAGLVPASTCRAGSTHMLGKLADKDVWVDDGSSPGCQICTSKFGLISNRKHHVRAPPPPCRDL
jgi:hypothetical protein